MLWADFILYCHFLYVLCVVVPVPLIIIGYFWQWEWIRWKWLRLLHLGMIGFVVIITLLGIPCPLTVWENEIRYEHHGEGYQDLFIRHWVTELLFYEFDPWVFAVIYVLFGGFVVWLFFYIPPKSIRNDDNVRQTNE